jgi:undecaprenyl-diphosphatase
MERLLAFDATLSRRFGLPLESGWWQLAKFTAHLGDGPYVFGGLGLAYLLSWFRDKLYFRRAILAITLIILTTMIIVTLIKFLVRRERPRPPGEFVTFKYDAYSFPSGHAARLAALAVSTNFFFPSFGWALAIITLIVAVARVAVGIHYVIDIVVGLAVGAMVAWGADTFVLPFLPSSFLCPVSHLNPVINC